MLVSYKWICEIAGISASPDELGDSLTFSGLEVEGIEHVGAGFDKIVVGEIKSNKPHPSRDNLSVLEVSSGAGLHQVVCGAPNTPGPGGRIVLALPGAHVGDLKIERCKLAGVQSEGMTCSEQELDLGPDHEGILVLGSEISAEPGTPIAKALDLEDWILDVGITPNRPDALRHRGIAREAALLFGQTYGPISTCNAPEGPKPIGELVEIEIVDTVRCPRYGAAVLTDVEIRRSPFHVRYRLHTLGIRPINNIVDMTNLVLLEFGQPLHAFDLDGLAGAKIVIRVALEGERMDTLDEEERIFVSDDLLICDAERPVAVAGLMGGLDTGVTEKTKNVLIECAYFEPGGIRRTSKRLKLMSESSYRFERGIDPNMGPDVLRAAGSLATDLAGGTMARGLIDCYPNPIEPKIVSLRPSRFNKLMGFDVDSGEIRGILEGIGCMVDGDTEKLEMRVPTCRPDIEREVDLIEEVARIRGFDKVPPTLPRIRCIAPDRQAFESARRAKELLAALGLDEVVTYSFVPEQMLAALEMNKDIIQIANPLSAARAAMRTTLLAGLLESLKRARSRFLKGVKQFEVARTFHDEGKELPREVLRAAGMLSGPAGNWVGEEERQLDLFDVKGIVEAFVQEYSGRIPVLKSDEEIACMHPRKACQVLNDGVNVGFFGELHPKILTGLKLPTGVCAFELSLDDLWSQRRLSRAKQLTEYPPMVRDVALLVDEGQDAGQISKALESECGSLAEEVRLFDIYRGQGIPDGKKSLAFSVVYQSVDRTLTDSEVDKLHGAAVAEVTKQFQAVQR